MDPSAVEWCEPLPRFNARIRRVTPGEMVAAAAAVAFRFFLDILLLLRSGLFVGRVLAGLLFDVVIFFHSFVRVLVGFRKGISSMCRAGIFKE